MFPSPSARQTLRLSISTLRLLTGLLTISLVATSDALASQITLRWNDNSNDESGFKIERALANLIFTQVAVVGPNVTAYTDSSLLSSTLYAYRVRAYNAAGNSAYSNVTTITTTSSSTTSNTAPTISSLANRTISEDGNTGAIAFTIGDAQTSASNLTLTGSSSNTTLVSSTKIVFGGSGSARTVTVTPNANKSGSATITIKVSDGSLTASKSFLLTVTAVNDAPTISNIPNQTTAVSTATALIPFTVGDVETSAGSLVVRGASSNTTLIPTANVVFGGSGGSRTVKVTPASGKTGSATITVTVTDGSGSSRNDTFTVSVGTATAPPTITLTSPVNGANYAAPTSIALAATVSANGHSITKVEFYQNAVLLGADSSSPYTFSWTTIGMIGTYTVTARVIYDSGSSITSAPATITVGLPAPWKTLDIGTVTKGSASASNGIYAVKGAGNLSGTADNFRFLYQALSGDGELKVRVSSAQNTGSSGSIGVMIRESLTKGARCAFVGMSADRKFRSLGRTTTSGSMASSTSGTATPPNVWLRIVRKGSTISRYYSTNGTSWTLMGSYNTSLATNVYIGIAVASGSSTTLNTSTFSSVTAVP